MDTEGDSAVNDVVNDKLRGGYYTPRVIADFISKWTISKTNSSVLEPSCGDGSIVKSVVNRFKQLGVSDEKIFCQVQGVELYEQEAVKARESGGNIVTSDFFRFYSDRIKSKIEYDIVVGNPPFIRYQNFEESYREKAFGLVEEVGITLNRLTNIWVPFLILSTECLNEKGKLGMVIPAELFQVDYAAETRKYLSEQFEHLIIITFRKLLFEGTQEEVVLLLGEKESKKKGIQVIELDDAHDLTELDLEKYDSEYKELDHSTEKWVKYYLNNTELALIRKFENDSRFSSSTDLFETNVGVVSGQNKFFVVDKKTIDAYRLGTKSRPIVGRAEQLSGIIFSNEDLEKLSQGGKKVYLFTPDNSDKESLSEGEKQYIEVGEKERYHEGYKCRIRKRWYIVPQSWEPDAFMLRQINKYPRIVFNETNATNTDTLHKIKFKKGIDGRYVAAAFINSFTFALCEITGRSYGGGVMSFEPGEVRKLKIPYVNADKLDVEYVDRCIREKDYVSAINYCDTILLKQGMGLSATEIAILNGIWEKLSTRRIDRKS